MKKIIPFKKDIIFKTNISEITSISLEHELDHDDNNIKGMFIISGDYKIVDTSVNVEEFKYEIPFDIRIDEKYETKDILIDIDDFYYEIINSQILSVNIDVLIDNLEEKNISELKENIMNIEVLNEENILEDSNRCIEEETVKKETTLNSVFDNINSENETYQSYHVYIVRENDTVEQIMKKYEITKEELEDYNDLTELKINDKIIIPTIYERS